MLVFLNIIQNNIKRSLPLLIDRSGNNAIERFQRIKCACTSKVCGFLSKYKAEFKGQQALNIIWVTYLVHIPVSEYYFSI